MADRNGISFEIQDICGVISESPKGWKKELNLVSWNGRKAKYDIRDWSPDHEKLGKGITLSVDELRQLGVLIDAELSRIDQGRNKSTASVYTATSTQKEKQKPENKQQDNRSGDMSGAVDYDEL